MTNDTEEKYNELKKKMDLLDYCVSLLDPDNRETIECLYYKGFTQREFARQKMIANGTVDARKKRALRELESLMNYQK